MAGALSDYDQYLMDLQEEAFAEAMLDEEETAYAHEDA